MTSNSSLVSVIIPVYNAGKYARVAIESALNQTYKNIEVICVDDCSSDDSLAVLNSFGDRIRVLRNEENSGIGKTRNAGIEVAKGDFLAFMDADDLWLPEKIEIQINEFLKDKNLDISFSYMKCFISPELPSEVKRLRQCPSGSMPGYIAGTAVVKRSSFFKIGLFNPKWRVGEFIDWMARAREHGLVSNIVPGVFLLRRIHETNTGVTERSSRNDYIRIMKESLVRKKKSL